MYKVTLFKETCHIRVLVVFSYTVCTELEHFSTGNP